MIYQYAPVKNDIPELLNPADIVDANGEIHTSIIFTEWSEQELKDIGIYKVIEDPLPSGKISTGSSLIFENDMVKMVHTLEDIPLSKARETKLKQLAAARYEFEVGGFDFNGSIISTDRQSQAMINGTHAMAKTNPDIVINFKTSDGFVSLDATTMISIAVAVGEHVQAAFNREFVAVNAVNNALTYDDIMAVEF